MKMNFNYPLDGEILFDLSNYNTRENLTLIRMQRLMIIPVTLTLWCEIVFIRFFGHPMPAVDFECCCFY